MAAIYLVRPIRRPPFLYAYCLTGLMGPFETTPYFRRMTTLNGSDSHRQPKDDTPHSLVWGLIFTAASPYPRTSSHVQQGQVRCMSVPLPLLRWRQRVMRLIRVNLLIPTPRLSASTRCPEELTKSRAMAASNASSVTSRSVVFFWRLNCVLWSHE